MIEQLKEMPLMEFSRLGHSRKRTIPLDKDKIAKHPRRFTYGNTRKERSFRIPRSPLRTDVKPDTGVKSKGCVMFDNVQRSVLLSRKKSMSRLLRSTSDSNIKINVKNDIENIPCSKTKLNNLQSDSFRWNIKRSDSFRWNIKRPNISRRKEVVHTRMQSSRAFSAPRSRGYSKPRYRASSAPRPRLYG